MFEECLESDTHVLVLVLLTELVAQFLDAELLESLVKLSLLALGHAKHDVRVDFLGLLPEVSGLRKDMTTDKVDSLVMLYHQVTFVVFGVTRAEHDNSVR